MGSGSSKKNKLQQPKQQAAGTKILAAGAFKGQGNKATSGKTPSGPPFAKTTAAGNNAPSSVEDLWPTPRAQRAGWVERMKADILQGTEALPLDQALIECVLGGLTIPDKAGDKKVVRIFLSSTFTDTTHERNMLIADVYPYLKQLSRRYGFEFGVSEMRWGIREEASSDHLTSQICMAEITRCQEESCGINYIVMMCDKYGYRPFPAQIEQAEFQQLVEQARADGDEDAKLVEQWFQLNSNVVPAQAILQPSSTVGNKDWWPIFERLQKTLRSASRALTDKERAKWYTVSVTEEEVHRGLLYLDNKNDVTFCYRRRIKDVGKHGQSQPKVGRRYVDLQGDKVVEDSQRLLAILRDKTLPAVLDQKNMKDYAVEWGPGIDLVRHATYLREFGDHFCQLLVDSISQAIRGQHCERDALYEEMRGHAVFCHTKAKEVLGRDHMLEQISQYLAGDDDHPYVVHGMSGSGKTSLMAKAILQSKDLGRVLLYRFLGTSEDSTSGRALLAILCLQLTRIYNQDASDIPSDFRQLCRTLEKNLTWAKSQKRPLIIFLDSLDQLSNEDSAWRLEWLPKSLPDGVKMVVSTLPDVGGCLKTLQLSLPEKHFLQMEPLSMEASQAVLESWLSGKARTLTADQMKFVLAQFEKTPLPLYLKISFETSCTWASYTPVDQRPLADTVKGLIRQTFDSLCRMHGQLLVSHALGYLTTARYGLSENEMEDLLSCDDEVLNDVFQFWLPPVRRVPPLLWVRIRTDLGPYLVERAQEGGAAVMAWYHRQFAETATERFLTDPVVKETYHSCIADHFMESWVGQSLPYLDKNGVSQTAERKVAPQPLVLNEGVSRDKLQYNRRKLTELPHALLQANRLTKFAEVVCSVAFIEAKCSLGLVYELLGEVQQASKMAQDQGKHELNSTFQQFTRLLQDNLSAFSKFPQSVLQQAANFPDDSHVVSKACLHLKSTTEHPRWLRHVNKSQKLSAKVMTLKWGQFDETEYATFSPDGSKLASGMCGATGCWYKFGVWDLITGAQLYTIVSTDNNFQQVAWSPAGNYIAAAMSKGNVWLMDPDTGVKVHGLDGDDQNRSKCYKVTFSSNGRLLAAAYGYKKKSLGNIDIYDTVEKRLLHCLLDSHKTQISGLCFSRDGRLLMSTEDAGLVKLWNAKENFSLLTTAKANANWFDEDKEAESVEEEEVDEESGGTMHPDVPSGFYEGWYTIDGQADKLPMSMPIKFLSDGTLSGEGTDETGEFTMTGSFDAEQKSVKIFQKYYGYLSTYVGALQCTSLPEPKGKLWGTYSMPCGLTEYKGQFEITFQRSLEEMKGQKRKALDIPLEPDGKYTAGINGADGSPDSCLLATAGHDGTLNIFAVDPDGGNALVSDFQQSRSLTSIYRGQLVSWIRFSRTGATPKDVKFHPVDGDRLYAACDHGSVEGFSLSTRQKLCCYYHGNPLSSISISADGSLLASVHSYDTGTIMLWNTSSSGEGVAGMKGAVGDTKAMDITWLQFSPCGRFLGVCINNCDYNVILDNDTGNIVTKIKKYTTNDSTCTFSSDSTRYLLAAYTTVHIYLTQTGEQLHKFSKVYAYNLLVAVFSPNDEEIAMVGQDQQYMDDYKAPGFIRVLDANSGEVRRSLTNFKVQDKSIQLLYSKDGQYLWTLKRKDISENQLVMVDHRTGEVHKQFDWPGQKSIYHYHLNAEQNRAALGCHDGESAVLDLLQNKIIWEKKPQTWRVNGIAMESCSHSGWLAAGCEDKTVVFLDENTGELLAYLESASGVSAVGIGRLTKAGKQHTYVAYGDEATFVKILELMGTA